MMQRLHDIDAEIAQLEEQKADARGAGKDTSKLAAAIAALQSEKGDMAILAQRELDRRTAARRAELETAFRAKCATWHTVVAAKAAKAAECDIKAAELAALQGQYTELNYEEQGAQGTVINDISNPPSGFTRAELSAIWQEYQ